MVRAPRFTVRNLVFVLPERPSGCFRTSESVLSKDKSASSGISTHSGRVTTSNRRHSRKCAAFAPVALYGLCLVFPLVLFGCGDSSLAPPTSPTQLPLPVTPDPPRPPSLSQTRFNGDVYRYRLQASGGRDCGDSRRPAGGRRHDDGRRGKILVHGKLRRHHASPCIEAWTRLQDTNIPRPLRHVRTGPRDFSWNWRLLLSISQAGPR